MHPSPILSGGRTVGDRPANLGMLTLGVPGLLYLNLGVGATIDGNMCGGRIEKYPIAEERKR